MILKYVIVSLLVMFDIVHDIELFSSIVIDDVKIVSMNSSLIQMDEGVGFFQRRTC